MIGDLIEKETGKQRHILGGKLENWKLENENAKICHEPPELLRGAWNRALTRNPL